MFGNYIYILLLDRTITIVISKRAIIFIVISQKKIFGFFFCKFKKEIKYSTQFFNSSSSFCFEKKISELEEKISSSSSLNFIIISPKNAQDFVF